MLAVSAVVAVAVAVAVCVTTASLPFGLFLLWSSVHTVGRWSFSFDIYDRDLCSTSSTQNIPSAVISHTKQTTSRGTSRTLKAQLR